MKTIEMSEILNLYRKCGIEDTVQNGAMRNTLNLGTLNNKLNIGNAIENTMVNNSIWTNNTLTQNNM